MLELAFDLLEPSSLALLSSDECGEGKLSVSELLLAPPGRDRGQKETQIRRQDWAYTINHFYIFLFFYSIFSFPHLFSC